MSPPSQVYEEPPKLAAFHAHLDKHQHCREHPFDLCPIGTQLLREAAEEAQQKLKGWRP